MQPFKILLIGKVPPPIGGVGVHLIRLMQSLFKDNINYSFFNLDKDHLYKIARSISENDLIHCNVSNSYLRFFIVALSRILQKKVIFTFHGNVGRFNTFKNKIDLLSFYFSSGSIVINQHSYDKVKKYKNVILIPAFIPPITIEELPHKLSLKIDGFIQKKALIFCTNAFGLKYDKNKNEIYGIFGLVSLFERNPDYGLIISDPSSDYLNYFKRNKILIPKNILLLSIEHDFLKILELSDCSIRATSTDGDSLSVKESLYFNKPCICSDVVDRIEGAILYKFNNWDDLNIKLKEIGKWKPLVKPEDGYPQILRFYKKIFYGE